MSTAAAAHPGRLVWAPEADRAGATGGAGRIAGSLDLAMRSLGMHGIGRSKASAGAYPCARHAHATGPGNSSVPACCRPSVPSSPSSSTSLAGARDPRPARPVRHPAMAPDAGAARRQVRHPHPREWAAISTCRRLRLAVLAVGGAARPAPVARQALTDVGGIPTLRRSEVFPYAWRDRGPGPDSRHRHRRGAAGLGRQDMRMIDELREGVITQA